MRWLWIQLTLLALSINQPFAQDLDLNSLTDAEFRTKADPLARALPLAMGGFFAGDANFLSSGDFRLSVNMEFNLPSDELAVGPLSGVNQFSLPIFQAAIGIDKRAELSGKFSAVNIGNRSVIITGYGLRFKAVSNEENDRGLTFGAMVTALRGPEDFRILDMTVQIEYNRVWSARAFKAALGTDFSEMRINVKAEDNLLTDQKEDIARTQIWLGIGMSQDLGGIVFLFIQLQQSKTQRINLGLGIRL
ncbi:MAG: hypothetical protein IID12_00400 [Candidatus Marinimicrobia bacterium]|nr:hypothetical protein [Candidatus Neomarinimicrobiota bacterium]